jgi:ABC-type amino acid transport substrate-binding protein
MLVLIYAIEAKALNVVGQDYAPFFYNDGSKGIQGGCFDVIQRLCAMESLHCKFKITPFRKSLDLLKTGEADIVCPLVENEPRTSAYRFSQPLFQTSYSFYGNQKITKKLKKYEDLLGLSLGVFGPSNTELSLQRINEFVDHKLKISIEPSVGKSLRKVESGRYDLAYANVDVAKVWIEKNRSKIVDGSALNENVDYRIAFSKKNINEETFKKIEEHLDTLRKSKELENICEKYKLKIAE